MSKSDVCQKNFFCAKFCCRFLLFARISNSPLYSTKLFSTNFKDLYPGHPNLDAYIFSGGSTGSNSAALKQVVLSLIFVGVLI